MAKHIFPSAKRHKDCLQIFIKTSLISHTLQVVNILLMNRKTTDSLKASDVGEVNKKKNVV
jgi:hypothetical protein